MMSEYVLVYDVSGSPERLRKVAKLCERHSLRVQNSVFELKLTEPQYIDFIATLKDIIKDTNDNVIVYQLNKGMLQKALRIGSQRLLHPDTDFLF